MLERKLTIKYDPILDLTNLIIHFHNCQDANVMLTFFKLMYFTLILCLECCNSYVCFFPYFFPLSLFPPFFIFLFLRHKNLICPWLSATLNSITITIIMKNYLLPKVYVTGYQGRKIRKKSFYIGISLTVLKANLCLNILKKSYILTF